jgi:hypothetical protein
MPERHLFEYATIRVVPRVEREEFINVGVIVYCAKQKFLKARFLISEERLSIFCRDLDLEELNRNLQSFVRICKAGPDSGPIGQYDNASRFRWLTATRSTVLQTSRAHAGFCEDAEQELLKLYEQLVL